MGGHLADRAEGGVRGRADEGVGDERAERASCLEGMTGTQEKTSAKCTSDLARLSTQLCNEERAAEWGGREKGVARADHVHVGGRSGGRGKKDSQQSSGHGAA